MEPLATLSSSSILIYKAEEKQMLKFIGGTIGIIFIIGLIVVIGLLKLIF